MKKFLATILLIALCAATAACGAPTAPAPTPAAPAAPQNASEAQPAAIADTPAPTTPSDVNADDAQSAPAPDAPAGKFAQGDLGVAISGKTYFLREDSAGLLAALGDGYEYSEIVSCVYEGMDKTYVFPGVKVNTVPVDGKDVIEMITLTDGTYATLRGVKVGQDKAALTAAYGEDYFDDGYVTYSLTNKPEDIQAERIQFEFSGDAIATIYIYSPSY